MKCFLYFGSMQKIVVLSGAGISAESGISTFRDNDGLWENHPIEEVATPEGWEANQNLVLQFYNIRRKQLFEVEPNNGHKALDGLEEKFDVQVVTQNIDDLHERAGSSNVLHLHGELKKLQSTIDPTLIYEMDSWELKHGEKCEKGSQLRPYVVWFGEDVPNIIKAVDIVKEADILIIVGTSLNVYPAAGLSHETRKEVPIFLVDPANVNTSNLKNVTHIKSGAGEGLNKLAEQLLKG